VETFSAALNGLSPKISGTVFAYRFPFSKIEGGSINFHEMVKCGRDFPVPIKMELGLETSFYKQGLLMTK